MLYTHASLLFYIYLGINAVPPEACFANFKWDDCGSPPVRVLYYWKPGSRCEVGIWRGCLPNLNMFQDEYECVATCIFTSRAEPADYHALAGIENLDNETLSDNEIPIDDATNQTMDGGPENDTTNTTEGVSKQNDTTGTTDELSKQSVTTGPTEEVSKQNDTIGTTDGLSKQSITTGPTKEVSKQNDTTSPTEEVSKQNDTIGTTDGLSKENDSSNTVEPQQNPTNNTV